MKATILGCGYVGTAVARLWHHKGHTVTATTTTPEKVFGLQAIVSQVAVVTGGEGEKLKQLLAQQDILLICVGAGRQASYEATYLNTAKTLAAILPQTSIRQVIFTSSYSLYGDHQGAWVDESTPVKPATANGETMAATERTLLDTITPQRRVCIFRLGGIYGPGRELSKIYGRIAGTTRPGTGEEGSNWIHLEDIVGAIDFACQHHLNGIYNLVQDEVPTVRELIQRVCDTHQIPPIAWDPSQPSRRPYNVRVANQKLKAAGYRFRHPNFAL